MNKRNVVDAAPGKTVVLPQDVPLEIVTGEVQKEGVFILAEEGTEALHIGWWSEKMQT